VEHLAELEASTDGANIPKTPAGSELANSHNTSFGASAAVDSETDHVSQLADASAHSATGDTGQTDTAAKPVSGDAPSSPKSLYAAASVTPTQQGPDGIRFDFNEGCRILLPFREKGSWRAFLRDLDTDNVLFQTETKGGFIQSTKRWFVRFSIEIWVLDEGADEPHLVLSHQYEAAGQDILIQFPVGTLGDSIAWFSYACRFGHHHPGCRVTCAMSAAIIPLFRESYPDIRFVTLEDVAAQKLNETAYATYQLGLFFNDTACDRQPIDFRHAGLHKTAGYILGVDLTEEAPRLTLADEGRPIAEPYAVIAVQATSGAKYWNNPNGWEDVVTFLKSRGYRVICIDQKTVHGQGLMWTHIPYGVEKETGRPLVECARFLKHASLFIGLSSGLSWLAWAAGCPTVLISGFSYPTTEFATPYRVINWHTCNSCWNDPALRFDHMDFLWCPRHANTPRHFECTRLITSAHVIRVIETIPGFGVHVPKM